MRIPPPTAPVMIKKFDIWVIFTLQAGEAVGNVPVKEELFTI